MEEKKIKFKIKKVVDNTGTWYWTIPQGFLRSLWYNNPFSHLFYIDTQDPHDVWSSLEEAEEHIKRWNSGYYKKKYYSKYV